MQQMRLPGLQCLGMGLGCAMSQQAATHFSTQVETNAPRVTPACVLNGYNLEMSRGERRFCVTHPLFSTPKKWISMKNIYKTVDMQKPVTPYLFARR